jgi:hypothetical protein
MSAEHSKPPQQPETRSRIRVPSDRQLRAMQKRGEMPSDEELALKYPVSPRRHTEALLRVCDFKTLEEMNDATKTLFKWAVLHTLAGHEVVAVDRNEDKYYEPQMPFLANLKGVRKKIRG